MKYLKWLIIIVVVIIVVAVAFVLLQPKPAAVSSSVPSTNNNPFADAVTTGQANDVTSPATFSINFYKWYVANLESNANFPSTQQLQTLFLQWTTTAFILQYQSESQDINFEEDPVLYSQDVPDGWSSGVTATVLNQTSTNSSVQVVIGTGASAQTYQVQLVMGSGHWLINSISSS